MLPLFALHFCLLVKVVNPCLILGYNSLDKIAGIIFIVRQVIPRNIEPIPFLIIGQHLRHPFAQTFDIPKISVRIDCTAPKLMPTSLAICGRSRLLSHITRVFTTLIFLSAVASLRRLDHTSSSVLSFPLKLCSPCFQCAIRRRLLPMGFNEVSMIFLERHSFL